MARTRPPIVRRLTTKASREQQAWFSRRSPGRPPRNNFTRTNSYAIATNVVLLDDLLSLTGGPHRDELLITSVNYVKDARGIWPDARGGAGLPAQRAVGRPYLFVAVLNLHRSVGLFCNRATNYRSFNQSNRTINQTLIPTQAGEGLDYSRTFIVAERKVRWAGQVRVQNLWNDRTALPWSADVDHAGSVFFMQRKTPGERQFILSSTIEF